MSIIHPVILPLLVALLLAVPLLLLAAPDAAHAQGLDVGVGGVSVGAGDGGVSVSVGSGGGADVGGESGSGGPPSVSAPRDLAGDEQELALEAVRSARALPLDEILVAARRHTSGEVIDARLIELRGFLLYELKIIEAGGDVSDLYIYARSGKIVRTE